MKTTCVLLIVLLSSILNCHAYKRETHREITYQAINISEQILQNKLIKSKIEGGSDEMLRDGISSPDNPITIREYIQYGGFMEDYPITSLRFLNHFYNPLNNSGLISGESSYVWANSANNINSWYYIRRAYLNGLTQETEAVRKNWLWNTFGSLGQVMHLVQDKAVPAHVRNDSHASPDPYEDFVENNNYGNFFSRSPVFYDGELGSGARAPRQLWDTERYNGTNPTITLVSGIGLAEYTNANFVSDDTIFVENQLGDYDPFNHSFPYPRLADTQLFDEDMGYSWNGYRVYRKYFEKIGGGVSVNHLATASRLYTIDGVCMSIYPADATVLRGLDDNCHSDYAEKLIPRAVGYSATLLQYFFRGDISMTVAPDNAGKHLVENLSNEAMSGTFSLYADDASGNRMIVEGSTATMAIPAFSVLRIEAFLPPVSAEAAVGYLLVFYGTLGQEEGAVTAVKVDVPPPSPIVVQEDPSPGWNRYLAVNNSEKTISGLLTLRYVSNENNQLVDKPVENVSWPVTLAPGEQVEVDAFIPPLDAEYPDQYQLVFKGTVNGEAQSLLYNRLTLPAIKPGWVEEWNNGLAGSHPWLSSGLDYPSTNLSNGVTTSFVDNGRLVKENTRTVATKGGRVNETTMRVPIVNASGQYCLSSYSSGCVPYNFGAEFPLAITPNTVVRVKIDELSVTPGVPHYDSCALTGYGQYQGIRMLFDNGVSISFTQAGQEPPDKFQADITPGSERNFNIYQAFAAAGHPFIAPVKLVSINVVQSLGNLCSPSTIEHRQRIKVDYIRLEENPDYGWY